LSIAIQLFAHAAFARRCGSLLVDRARHRVPMRLLPAFHHANALDLAISQVIIRTFERKAGPVAPGKPPS
jgi:hypothetical protein